MEPRTLHPEQASVRGPDHRLHPPFFPPTKTELESQNPEFDIKPDSLRRY